LGETIAGIDAKKKNKTNVPSSYHNSFPRELTITIPLFFFLSSSIPK
jgi:hypothetical protein